MSLSSFRKVLIVFCLLGFATQLPAPLIYRPGEGWVYEEVGEDSSEWMRGRAKDQLDVAQAAFDEGRISTALKAAKRLIARWPLSDYAPQATFIMARCYEEKGHLQKAFEVYQELIENYPKTDNYSEVLERQYEIANQFLAGRWFRLWRYIPLYPSMDKTAEMYAKVVRNGPYSQVGPKAQMAIGEARENQREYRLAEQAYIRAADRYNELPGVAANAIYRAALALEKQANKAGYDQGTAGDAIEMFTDFRLLYPLDERVEQARTKVKTLSTEQALGAYQTARYYEKRRKWLAAEIYYNEVLLMDNQSEYAEEARVRLAELQDYTNYLRAQQGRLIPDESESAAQEKAATR